MELADALAQIAQIREQIARTQIFRGYRSLTVGCSGTLAILASIAQAWLMPRPEERLDDYVYLWAAVAAASFCLVAAELWLRGHIGPAAMARQATVSALEQFLPCIAAGAMLTVVIVLRAPSVAWMLPGLWAVLFSLGVFASCRLLPRPIGIVGAYYLLCGLASLAYSSGPAALSPWWMGITFGGGQILAAATLYVTLEHGAQ